MVGVDTYEVTGTLKVSDTTLFNPHINIQTAVQSLGYVSVSRFVPIVKLTYIYLPNHYHRDRLVNHER